MPEQVQNTLRLDIERLHGAKQGSFVVEGFARPGEEDCRDAEGVAVRILVDICGAGHIPGRVTACFECVADTTTRKAGGIGLLLSQGAAGKMFNGFAVEIDFKERVMLFSSRSRQGLEPMRIVAGAPAGSGLRDRARQL